MAVEVHMLPIKAGDSTLIVDRSDSRPFSVLIDAGLAKDEVVAYLQSVGVYHLDLVILSHPDLDHLQGLLALIRHPLMSIGEMWCFDLSFLRHFVETGIMPPPQADTHIIAYHRCCFALVTDHEILKAAAIRGIRTLQVCEGYRANFGSRHLEVMYPWNGFHRALRDPTRLKELLAKKWPAEWAVLDREEGESRAQELTRENQRDVLDGILSEYRDGMERVEPHPLATPSQETAELEESAEDAGVEEDGKFPASMLGTLYNNLSIVVKMHVLGGINGPVMLFPGDLTDWTYLVARRFDDLRSHIFKYPHHGSAGPGVSRQVFRHRPMPPWRCCPCGPWCSPDCYHLCRDRWREVEHALMRQGAAELFARLVRPRHTLVFPYPSQGLPRPEVLTPSLGEIHANRADIDPKALRDKGNRPVPCVLDVGQESHEIRLRASRQGPHDFINPWNVNIPDLRGKRARKDQP